MDIVYNISETGAAVFAERTKAEHVGRIHRTFASAGTWSEVRAGLGEDAFAELLEYVDPDDHEVGDAAAFSTGQVPAYCDGDYPEWLQQTMLEWMPREIVTQFSTEASVLNGDFLEIPASAAEDVASRLRTLGHMVERVDQPLL